jgi:hypothetical protein
MKDVPMAAVIETAPRLEFDNRYCTLTVDRTLHAFSNINAGRRGVPCATLNDRGPWVGETAPY